MSEVVKIITRDEATALTEHNRINRHAYMVERHFNEAMRLISQAIAIGHYATSLSYERDYDELHEDVEKKAD